MKNSNTLTLFRIIFIFSLTFVLSCKPKSVQGSSKEEKIAEIIENMKKSPEWMQALQQKAMDWGKPLDSVMYIDAVWMIDQEGK
jgi:hypothetical protein